MTNRESSDPIDLSNGVLVVSGAVGAGHVQAARAIVETLAQVAPDLPVEHVDILDFVPRLFRLKYADGYALTVSRFPTFYGWGFAITDHPKGPGRSLMERRRLFFEARAQRRFLDFLQQSRPRLVVHTHFLAPPAIARWNRLGLTDIRQMIAITDIIPHRFWYTEGIDHWFVAQPESTERLRSWDIDERAVTVSGIPIAPKWSAPLPDATDLRRTWGLPDAGPVVLLSGGTNFVCGPVVRIARRITRDNPQACVAVLTGRNDAMFAELKRLGERMDGRIVPIGFTDRVHELVGIASLMVTKPGGLTTAECLAKGCPMVLMRPVPGQEAQNARFFTEAGAAVTTRSQRSLVESVRELLHDQARRKAMSVAAKDLYRPGAQTLAKTIINDHCLEVPGRSPG